jgi:anti-sigma B factor antagonist
MPAQASTERDVGDVTILRLQGQLKEEGDIPLTECVAELVRRGRRKIVLDLKDVSRVDSTGVGMVAAKYLTVRRLGGDLKLLHLSPRARQLLAITKLADVFETFDDEEEALRSFGNPARPFALAYERRVCPVERGALRRRAADRGR